MKRPALVGQSQRGRFTTIGVEGRSRTKTDCTESEQSVSSKLYSPYASEPEFIFIQQALADKLPTFICEYRFDDVRRFRFDFAWPDQKLAVEIEGGIFSRGAHGRPLGIMRDMEKGNLAVMKGWSVLRFTPAQVKNGEAISTVKQWLGANHA